MSTKCAALAVLVGAHALIFESTADIQVFTVNKCADIVDKANASGHVTEESGVSVCRKHWQSKETCSLLGEMLALAQIRDDFNKSSFCEMMSSAHACSAAMEDFLSSDAVADLAFGHCLRSHRLKQAKTDATTDDYCQRFQGVLSAAVKASESVDTLRECYMMELEQKSKKIVHTANEPKVAKEAPKTQVQPTPAAQQLQEAPKTQVQPTTAAQQLQEAPKTQVQPTPAAQQLQEASKTQVQPTPAAQQLQEAPKTQVQPTPAAQQLQEAPKTQVQPSPAAQKLQEARKTQDSQRIVGQQKEPGIKAVTRRPALAQKGNLTMQVLGNSTKGQKEYAGFLSKFVS